MKPINRILAARSSTQLNAQPITGTAPRAIRGLSLRKNLIWTLTGNVVYAGCQWGMLVVLAKLGTPEMVGQFALGFAITAPVMMFACLGLRNVQATESKSEYLFGHYSSLRIVTSGLALLIIAGVTFSADYRKETALVILVVAVAKVFESFSDVIYGLLQRHERMDRIAKSMMVKGFLSVLALGLVVYITGSVLGGAIALALTWALVFLLFDLSSSSRIVKDLPHHHSVGETKIKGLYILWDSKKLCALFWIALPLGAVALLWSLKVNIPRYFIEHYLGEHQLGIFAALAYLMIAGNTIVGALAQTSISRLAKYYSCGKFRAFQSLLLIQILFGIILGGIGLLFAYFAGKDLLTILYTTEYARYTDVLFWIMAATALTFVTSFLDTGLTAARYFRIETILHALTTITTLLACYFLIPTHGLTGAALALVVSGIFALAIRIPFLAQILFSRGPRSLDHLKK